MKKVYLGFGAGLLAVSSLALDLVELPPQGAYPSAVSTINSNAVMVETEVNALVDSGNTLSNSLTGITNQTLKVLIPGGTTNTLVFTNGTLRSNTPQP